MDDYGKRHLAEHLNELDCQAASCYFAKQKTGQRNNGPCRCLDGLNSQQKRKVLQYIKGLEKAVNDENDRD